MLEQVKLERYDMRFGEDVIDLIKYTMYPPEELFLERVIFLILSVLR